MHPTECTNACKILNGELFFHYPEIIALERALDRMGCLAPVPFGGGEMGCRMPTDKGRLLLAALQHANATGLAPEGQAEVLAEFCRARARRFAAAIRA